ncbi:hypothetical protein R1flu_014450 [Riccia fluitans]|uniref:tRNA (guanine(9)-N(1))-methyltransferase n=1 Tax=Riccia fluitans TaxID=41844 RepID=A0ABD1YG51_9MARC
MIEEKASDVIETEKEDEEKRANKKVKVEHANDVCGGEAQPMDASCESPGEDGKGLQSNIITEDNKTATCENSREDGNGLENNIATEDSKTGSSDCENGGENGHDQTDANGNLKVELEEDAAGADVKGDGSDSGQESGDSTRPPSNRSMKKAMRRERWKIQKKLKKKAVQERNKEKKAKKILELEERRAAMTQEEIEAEKEEGKRKRQERKNESREKKEKIKEAMTSGQNYVIDLEFCHLMTPEEIVSLIQQVMYSYAANGKAEHPGRLTLTGIQGQIKESLERISGYGNWLLQKEERSYMDVFQDRTQDLVYLTADSPNLLEEIDPSKIYIIGGLVDRNRHKSITLKKAEEQGIATAKIPVGDHLKMRGSQVLTVNQVMELMLGFQSHKDWKRTLNLVVPLRRRAVNGCLEEQNSPGGTQAEGKDHTVERAESSHDDEAADQFIAAKTSPVGSSDPPFKLL